MNFIDQAFSDSFSDMHRGLNKFAARGMKALFTQNAPEIVTIIADDEKARSELRRKPNTFQPL